MPLKGDWRIYGGKVHRRLQTMMVICSLLEIGCLSMADARKWQQDIFLVVLYAPRVSLWVTEIQEAVLGGTLAWSNMVLMLFIWGLDLYSYCCIFVLNNSLPNFTYEIFLFQCCFVNVLNYLSITALKSFPDSCHFLCSSHYIKILYCSEYSILITHLPHLWRSSIEFTDLKAVVL